MFTKGCQGKREARKHLQVKWAWVQTVTLVADTHSSSDSLPSSTWHRWRSRRDLNLSQEQTSGEPSQVHCCSCCRSKHSTGEPAALRDTRWGPWDCPVHRSAPGEGQGTWRTLPGKHSLGSWPGEKKIKPIYCHTWEKGYILPHFDLSDKVIKKTPFYFCIHLLFWSVKI